MPAVQIKHFLFKASLIPSLVTVILLYVMISLGNWQLDRAEYKANLQSIIESRQDAEAVNLSSLVDKPENSWLYHPVKTVGQYDVNHQILLDNQVNNMVAGYSVFTPLKLSASEAILVNRGWVAQGRSRSELPALTIDIITDISLTGLLASPPSKGMVLSKNANSYSEWPVVLQYVNINEIESSLGYKLLPMILIINDINDTSFDIMPIKINMRSEKHTGYAFQWFALSLTLLIIYIVVNTKNTKKSEAGLENE